MVQGPQTLEQIWRMYDAIESRLTAPLSERMLDLADLRPGTRVLDIATGRGEPAIRAAHRVGPSGLVVGVDLSEPMLTMARERANREGVSTLDLRVEDAQTLADIPLGYFDVAMCRWGLMYMPSAMAALSRIGRALIPGGVFIAALWAEPERVPYYSLPRRLLEAYRLLPAIDWSLPGVFHYSNPSRFEQDFHDAGFRIDCVEEMEVPVVEAHSSAEIVEWTRAFGLAPLLQDLAEPDVRAWEHAMNQELEQYRTNGVIQLGGVTRIVRARRAH